MHHWEPARVSIVTQNHQHCKGQVGFASVLKHADVYLLSTHLNLSNALLLWHVTGPVPSPTPQAGPSPACFFPLTLRGQGCPLGGQLRTAEPVVAEEATP